MADIDTSFDRSGMLNYYKAWPDQFSAYTATIDIPPIGTFDHVLITGKGASLVPSLFIYSMLMPDVPKGLEILKGLEPPRPEQDTLFIAVSLGGDTLEVVYALKKALEKGYDAIALTGGGLLEKAAKKWNVPLLRMPKAPTSRLGFPIITLAVASTLDKALGLRASEILRKAFEELRRYLEPSHEEAKALARWMNDAQNLVVYHSAHQEVISLRLKYLLSENAKLRSYHEDIMDVIHNGIGCWEYEYGSKLIILRDPLDHEIISSRFDIVRDVLTSLNFKVREIPIYQGDRATFLLRRLYTLDLATVYLGLLRRSDPSIVRTQSIARQKMKESSYFRKLEEEVSS